VPLVDVRYEEVCSVEEVVVELFPDVSCVDALLDVSAVETDPVCTDAVLDAVA
jgi:hypothetical protein